MKGLIAWFASNSVVANLLMISIVGAGLMSLVGIPGLSGSSILLEVFPEISVDMVSVSVEYRGAAPEEVEEGICIKIEEAVQDLEGIKKITSVANEGSGSVAVEVQVGYDVADLVDDIKTRVDAIDTFPDEAEKPVIREITNRTQVINVSIAGDTDELTLKRLGERVRDDLLAVPGITQVDLKNARPYEIAIEVSEQDLRRYNLTFDSVADAVRVASLDLPGGSVKTDAGEILLRTKGQAYVGREFEDLTLLTRPDGSRIRLGDVAKVIDGFEEADNYSLMDGKPSVMVQVFRVGDQNAVDIVDKVYAYIEDTQPTLPEGIVLTPWADAARILKGRMDLLIRNAQSGLILVFVVLALFLRLRLAFWVTLGIPISFLGTLAIMPSMDVSINMISLFSFILVLGIVVDDAIVVGESIFEYQAKRREGPKAAIEGTQHVAIPVIFGVLTSVVAFAPMLFVPGYMGKIWRVIPAVIIPTLLFSLVESQLILPAHLSHYSEPKPGRRSLPVRLFNGFFDLFANGLDWFVYKLYRPALHFALNWRYLTVAWAMATMLLTVGLVGGGFIKFVFFPQVESDNVVADVTMPQETPAEVTGKVVRELQASIMEVLQEVEREQGVKIHQHVMASVGEQPFAVQAQRNAGGRVANASSSNMGEVNVELIPSEERSITASEIVRRWRERTPAIPDVVELTFSADLLGGGKAIDIQFAGRDLDRLQEVVAATKTQLAEYPGVIDISDSFRGGKPEIKLDIKPEAESLGLSLQALGRQVRQAFFGEEAQRIQRGRDEVRVMVRYPEQERRSIGDLENMRIRTPDGAEVPFSEVAEANVGRGFATITRANRRRTIDVTAEVDESVANANEVLADLEATFLPGLLDRYRGVTFSLEGEQQSQMEAMSALGKGFVAALFIVYVLMAIPFKSYLQPLIVMSAVPFGIVGAIWGHAFMGLSMSILSMCGIVALTGVVVNDSLVLVNFINHHRDEGFSRKQAVLEAGVTRFRPILLTSLTTAAGVTPLMLEKSVQAQFLIPMAVALAFGVLFATFITLALVPAIYLILEDFKGMFRWLMGRPAPLEEDEEPATEGPERIETPQAARGALPDGAAGD
ncbi:MAG: efflux RND transporter permease subunit [Bryobacterales bacterium]|nr:efflux RND transporter permease subunit [Bryobacterales bacterium]